MPVQRADADAGLAGDGLHGGAAALLVEDLAGGRDEELVVALGVGPHGARVAPPSSPRSIVVVAVLGCAVILLRSLPAPSGPTDLGASNHAAKKQSCKAEAPSVY